MPTGYWASAPAQQHGVVQLKAHQVFFEPEAAVVSKDANGQAGDHRRTQEHTPEELFLDHLAYDFAPGRFAFAELLLTLVSAEPLLLLASAEL